MSFNIAIDGPAGAGKSTIAKQLAKELSFIYVDTGAMYRALAFYLLRNAINAEDETAIANACGDVDITIQYQNGEQCIYLNGENVNAYIRTEEVGSMTSKISVYPVVREKLTALQKKLAKSYDVIMDGRDIGTCVLPHAQIKIYLTADAGVRAKRRCGELKAKGIEADYARIKADIIERDNRDMQREVSPLRQAEDAVAVDTSDMDIKSVLDVIKKIYEDYRQESCQTASGEENG